MHHKKTSLFLSGMFLSIEFLLFAIFVFARSLFGASFFFAIFGLDIYRLYRKMKFRSIKDPLTYEKTELKRQAQRQINSYYWNIWYRFADASDHDFIAKKLHEQIKKTQR
jgi:hypothetical protein